MVNYLNKFHLNNKKALILGGLGLIGKEVSIAYANAGANARVLDINKDSGKIFEKEMINKSCDLTFATFDCSDEEQITNNFPDLIKGDSCPDIFINCSYPRTADWAQSSFKEITIKSLKENVNMQLNNYIWLSHLVAKSMVKNSIEGSIIQFGSTYGIVGQDLSVYENTEMHENMSYAIIKGGIVNSTRSMASYYGQFGIRVNTLCPGGLKGHVAGKSEEQDPIFVENYSKKTPLRRLGKAEEVASVALFLASEASSYITGATIMVDGGWTAV